MKNKSFIQKTCCGYGTDLVYGKCDPCGGSRTEVRVLGQPVQTGGFHHGEEEKEDEDAEVTCQYRSPSFKTGAGAIWLQTQLRLDVCQERVGLVLALLLCAPDMAWADDGRLGGSVVLFVVEGF
jgi:hypothetical protein